MTTKQIRNIALLACAVSIASCTQFTESTPKTVEGEWLCAEDHFETGKQTYYIHIEYSDSNKKALKIQNFNNLSGYCSANISGSTITIPKQTIEKHVIVGNGSVSSDYKTILFNYNDDIYGDGGGKVSATCSRKQ